MKRHIHIAVAGLILFLVMIIQGCSTFQSRRALDMAPFSETMTSLVGDIQFGMQGKNWIYTNFQLKTKPCAQKQFLLPKIRSASIAIKR